METNDVSSPPETIGTKMQRPTAGLEHNIIIIQSDGTLAEERSMERKTAINEALCSLLATTLGRHDARADTSHATRDVTRDETGRANFSGKDTCRRDDVRREDDQDNLKHTWQAAVDLPDFFRLR